MKEKKVLALFVAAFVALTATSGELLRSTIGFAASAESTLGTSDEPTIGTSDDEAEETTTPEETTPAESDETSSSTSTVTPAESEETSSSTSTKDPTIIPEETPGPVIGSTTPTENPSTTSPVVTAPSTTAATAAAATTAKTTEEPKEEDAEETAEPVAVKVKVDDAEAAAKVPAKNKVKNVSVVPSGELKDKDGKAIDLSKVTLAAKEIFKPETVKAAKKAVTKVLEVPAANMNVLDLSMKMGKTNLSKSFDGKIAVTIEIPRGQKGKQFELYRIVEKKGKMTATLVEGTLTDDGYEVELDELGMFVLVAVDEVDDK